MKQINRIGKFLRNSMAAILVLLAALCVIGCEQPSPTPVLKNGLCILEGAESKTLVSSVNLNVVEYLYKATPQFSGATSGTTTDWQHLSYGGAGEIGLLTQGKWTFELKGVNTEGKTVTTGTATVYIEPEKENLIQIQMKTAPSIGVGTISYSVWTQKVTETGTTLGVYIRSGTNHILCKVCGEKMEDVVVEKLGHAWGETVIVKAATCSEEGSAKRTCSRCGEENTGTIARTPHIWDGNIVRDVEPDCKNDGKGHISCTNCTATQDVIFPATGEHNLIQNGEDTPATKYTRPIAHKICTVCGEKVDEPYGEPLGHVHKTAETINIPATCSTAGKTVQYCSCYTDEEGNIYQEDGEGRTRYIINESLQGIDPNNHSYGNVQMNPAGFTHGSVAYQYCPNCGQYTGKEYGDAESFAGTWNFTGAFTGYLTINPGYGENSQYNKPIDFKTYGSVDGFSGECTMMLNGLYPSPLTGTWESQVRFENGNEIDELRITIPTLKGNEVYLLELGVQDTATGNFTGTIMTITGHPVINITKATV